MSAAMTLGEQYLEAQTMSRALGAQLAALGDRRRRVASRVVTPLADRARALLRGEPVQADPEAVEARRAELERIEAEQRVVGEAARLLAAETLEPLRGEIGYTVWQTNRATLENMCRDVIETAVELSRRVDLVLRYQASLNAAGVTGHSWAGCIRRLNPGHLGEQLGRGDYGPLAEVLRYVVDGPGLLDERDVAKIRGEKPLPVPEVVIPPECRAVQK